MPSTKHTPGPWRTEDRYPGNVYCSDVTGSIVARCDGFEYAPRPAGEIVANVALIAAAPDLLKLAKQYWSECGECAGTGVTPDDQDCSECRFIRDVLAKALPA